MKHIFVSVSYRLCTVAEIQFFEWGGGQGPSISESGEMFLFDLFAGRPDINKVLKCAKRIGMSDFTTSIFSKC